jgi:hypothetical protein
MDPFSDKDIVISFPDSAFYEMDSFSQEKAGRERGGHVRPLQQPKGSSAEKSTPREDNGN